MSKYVIDNTFGFQPKVHQINSLRQKHALRIIISVLHHRGRVLSAARHGKIVQQTDRANLCAAATEFAVLRHTTQTHPDTPYLTKE